jgi:hypothetical protein
MEPEEKIEILVVVLAISWRDFGGIHQRPVLVQTTLSDRFAERYQNGFHPKT